MIILAKIVFILFIVHRLLKLGRKYPPPDEP